MTAPVRPDATAVRGVGTPATPSVIAQLLPALQRLAQMATDPVHAAGQRTADDFAPVRHGAAATALTGVPPGMPVPDGALDRLPGISALRQDPTVPEALSAATARGAWGEPGPGVARAQDYLTTLNRARYAPRP